MWEYERFDWSRLRSSVSAVHVPVSIEQLRTASSKAAADKAYWKIDNEVIVQGALYEAAVPAATCLARALSACTGFARPRIVELLYQLGNGVCHPAEPYLDADHLARLCRQQSLNSLSLVLDALEQADSAWVDLCVDLLMQCADEAPQLRGRVSWYFRRLLEKEPADGVRAALKLWLDDSGPDRNGLDG